MELEIDGEEKTGIKLIIKPKKRVQHIECCAFFFGFKKNKKHRRSDKNRRNVV